MSKIRSTSHSNKPVRNLLHLGPNGEVLSKSDAEDIRKGDGLSPAKFIARKISRDFNQADATTSKLNQLPTKPQERGIYFDPLGSRSAIPILCPICQCTVSRRRLKNHLAKHSRGKGKKRSKTKASDSFHQPISNSASTNPITGPTAQDHLGTRDTRDASKEWAHAYRDGGKFGSHPIIDGHTEDSSP